MIICVTFFVLLKHSYLDLRLGIWDLGFGIWDLGVSLERGNGILHELSKSSCHDSDRCRSLVRWSSPVP